MVKIEDIGIGKKNITSLAECFDAETACNESSMTQIDMLIEDINKLQSRVNGDILGMANTALVIEKTKPFETNINKIINTLKYSIDDLREAQRLYRVGFWKMRATDLNSLSKYCETKIKDYDFRIKTAATTDIKSRLVNEKKPWVDLHNKVFQEIVAANDKITMLNNR